MRPHSFFSPLRYPGGKGMLSNYMQLVVQHNELLDGHYAEVYAGGAAVAWALLFDEYVRYVHINDISKPISAFWQSVLGDTDALCKLINDTPVTMEEWRRQKQVLSNLQDYGHLEIGFATFFLNRTNRSGIITGGVIGGKAQSGVWKLDARFNKQDLVARIQRIASYGNRIILHNKNASDFLKTELPNLPAKTLVYLDPPYYVKGQGLYEDYYVHEDHDEISRLVEQSVKQPWIVSYDATPTILFLYGGYRNIRYNISYSAQERYAGSEVMFFSEKLLIPPVQNPVTAKASFRAKPVSVLLRDNATVP